MMGLVAQQAFIICLTVCIPVAALWCNMSHILVSVGQAPAMSQGVGIYLAAFVPGLGLAVACEVMRRFLASQQIVRPTLVITIIGTLLGPIFNWLLIFK